jgi:hypothetical protein
MPDTIFRYFKTSVSIYFWIYSGLFLLLGIRNYSNSCSLYLVSCLSIVYNSVRFEVLTAVSMKSKIFLVVTPCSSVNVCRRFGGTSVDFYRNRWRYNPEDRISISN